MWVFRFTQNFKKWDIEQVGFAIWAIHTALYEIQSKTGLIPAQGHHPQEQHILLIRENRAAFIGILWETPHTLNKSPSAEAAEQTTHAI